MNHYDLQPNDLRSYLPKLTATEDFTAFWQTGLNAAKLQPLNMKITPLAYPGQASLMEVSFDGFANSRIHGTLIRPNTEQATPVLVHFHGYGMNRRYPHQLMHWLNQGIAVYLVDIRGQDPQSPDKNVYQHGTVPGFLTLGILTPENYYFRSVYLDSVRAVWAMAQLDSIDPNRIGVIGESQGGGLALATAALEPKIRLSLANVPFLAHFRRSVELFLEPPYSEIPRYFRVHDPLHQTDQQVYETLSYVDVMNLAPRIECPTLVGVGLEDPICPPSGIFAAYNHIPASTQKEIRVYSESGHELTPLHEEERIAFVQRYL